jgi:hypothetical protein
MDSAVGWPAAKSPEARERGKENKNNTNIFSCEVVVMDGWVVCIKKLLFD